MILSDVSILERLRSQDPNKRIGLSVPDEEGADVELLVNEAGIKLRLSRRSEVFPYGGKTQNTMSANKLYRSLTMERIEVPPDLKGAIFATSSMARLGLAITCDSPYIQPGWRGQIVLEMHLVRPEPLMLLPGMVIGELVFHQLSTPTSKPYSGKYQDQDSLEPLPRYSAKDYVLDLSVKK